MSYSKKPTSKTGNFGKKALKNVVSFANSFANPENFANLSQISPVRHKVKEPDAALLGSLACLSFQNFSSDMNLCKLFLDTRRKKNDGTFPVRLKVGGSSKLWLPTGVCLKPEDWDPDQEVAIGRNARNINMELAAYAKMIKARLVVLMETRQWKTLSSTQQKALLTDPEGYERQQAAAAVEVSLGAFFEKVITTKKSPRTREIYASTLKKLQDYCDPYTVSFDDLTKIWIKDFEASLSDLAPNSVSIHLRNLRNVVNCAIDEEITEKYSFRRYDIPKEATRKRSLDVEKFRRFLAVPNLKESQKEHRDMFLLIFLLMGINLVDLAALTHDNLKDGRLEYRRSKTGRLYSIKIEPEIAALLKKYKGHDHLLAFADRYVNHKDYGKRLNDAIRKIGEWEPRPLKDRHRGVTAMVMKPIEPELSSYWARHTWATIARKIGVSVDDIALALGHSTGHDTTRIYIDEDNEKIDIANRRVIDFLLHFR